MQILQVISTKLAVIALAGSSLLYAGLDHTIEYIDNVIYKTTIIKETFQPVDCIPEIKIVHDTFKEKIVTLDKNFLYALAETTIVNKYDHIFIKYNKGKFNVKYSFTDSIFNKYSIIKTVHLVKTPLSNMNPNNTINDTLSIKNQAHIFVK